MAGAPYPGLAPDLWDIVRALQDDPDPVPEHLRSIEQLRDAMRAVEAQRAPLAPEIFVMDDTLRHGSRQVPARIYHGPNARSDQVMVYFHGGGWSLGGLDGHDSVCADIALHTGLTVVSLDYALAPEHPYPAALEDGLAAIHALRASSVDVWLGGDSAGGTLALGAALRLRDADLPPPMGLFLIYPALDPECAMPSHVTHADAPYLTTLAMRRHWADYLGTQPADIYAAPGRADLTGLPPAVLLTAELDPLVDEGDALADAFGRAGIDCWHHRAEGLIHGFLRFRARSPSSQGAFLQAVKAVRERLDDTNTR